MVRHLLVFVLILLPCVNTVLAHEDFYRVRDFENVKVRIKTGFEYEEINKVAIIGELAQRLTESTGYRETVLLDFLHFYTGDCVADHFISFGDGADAEVLASASPTGEKPAPFLKSPAVVIRQVSRSFDVAATLKLVEYAVSHVAEVKRDQRLRLHRGKYNRWQALSIDKDRITKIIAAPVSPAIEKVWQEPAIRPETGSDKYPGISYRFKDGRYVVYYWSGLRYQRHLLSLEDIYDFQKVSSSEAIVFDTDESFYYVSGNPYGADDRRTCSKRRVIKNTQDYYKPYEAHSVGGDKIAICFSYLIRNAVGGRFPILKHRVLIYRPDRDDLVQDLDELLNRR